MKKHLFFIPLLTALVFCGCKKDEATSPVELVLNQAEASLKMSSAPLQLTVAGPENYAGSQNIDWLSTNRNVATVSETGVVTPLTPGNVVIVGYMKGQKNVRGECKITVLGKIDTSLATEFADYTINAGDTAKVKYTYSPKVETCWEFNVDRSDSVGSKYINQTNSNSDPKEYGKLNFAGLYPGVVKVTLVNKVDATVKASFNITINEVAMESFNLDKAVYDVKLGEFASVKTIILPKAAAYRKVFYKSSNPEIFTINDGGTITPVAGGSAYVYATTQDGKQTSAQVTVIATVIDTKKITFEKDSVTYGVGINDVAGEVAVTAAPVGASPVTVTVDDTYVPKSGLKSNISVTKVDDVKTDVGVTKWKVSVPFGISGYGTARLIAQNGTKDAKGKLITDTCIVTVTGMDSRLLLTKSQYYAVELGAKTFVTASASRFEFKPTAQVTLQEAVLYLPKGAMYYDATTKTNTKLKEDKVIETLTPNRVINARGTQTVTFSTIPSASHIKSLEVKYTFKTSDGGADAYYTMSQQVVAGNGAPYSAPLQ